ncbi:helix-turn-helix domain-containing protein [Psychrobacillus lasiicapitis]|uniref:Helix-turn-helix domain-containing protein n=1 Tax=Psychrobacillus lasiicapitis TaxID=1636719 RepID=A0A544TH37_9BACI|nr:XRE family transcriptional regulator [Psychrobacillus lasiicapitis]TQR16772.1 helix-turn-helix domain-containing protein [Psychrobacillus lasiicapitis]GGA27356.1 transcriptional regulator [Psychrobacillus lasiicapitis]
MDHINQNIGKNLNRVRKERNISLDKTSELTGVSKTMLGQIERGESNPTVTTLWKIANGLRLSFSSLISEENATVSIIKKNELKPVKESNGQYQVYPLVPFNADKQFEVFAISLASACEHKSEAHNLGVKEYIFVNEGTLEIEIDGENYVVNREDAITFQADRTHFYRNNGDSVVKCTVIIHYPS